MPKVKRSTPITTLAKRKIYAFVGFMKPVVHYGFIPAGPPIKRSRAQEPLHKSARRVTHRDKRVRQPSWRRTYLAPGLLWGDKRHAYPLQLLSNIVGGGASSRLYRKLVVEDKVAVSAGAYYAGDGNGPGRFVFYASPSVDVSMDDLEKAVEAEIAKFIKSGVSERELKRAKRKTPRDRS